MNVTVMHRADERLQILVVEDDPTLGRLIERILRQWTVDVTVVRTGNAAIAAIQAHQFHAIASDISLPDMSGLDVIAQAREASPSSGIVAITGFVDVDVAVQSMKAGADDFLGKPFDPEILWHMLNKAVDSRATRAQAEQAAVYRQLAYTDALTGCPNRRFIDEFIDDAVSRARRAATALTVAYIDIDNFKLLNDFVGHEEGDNVLIAVAHALEAEILAPASFGRFGGDEFVVVFPGCTKSEARRAMERVRKSAANIEVMNGARVSLPTRISCGFSEYRGESTPRALIAEAEDQMYLDKNVTPSLMTPYSEGSIPEPIVKVTNLKALRNLVKAIDRRDSYTRFHSDHATHLAIGLAKELGLDGEHLSAITIGGPIHDLGKIVVPDEILRKPGALTPDERRAMEEHPIMGAAITAAVTDYDSVVNLVRHHHERFDGGGYPGNLKGEEITITTRIFTLADAVSAMTTDRPYRKGLTIEQAVDQVRKNLGTQFDPELGRTFANMLERQAARKDAAA
jgi:diguanylate cyclase (GGDEF)-like protein